jgi:iron complex transport system permease protein
MICKKHPFIYSYRGIFLIIVAFIVLIVAVLVSISLGRYPLRISDIFLYIFTGKATDSNMGTVLLDVRLPRIIAAVVSGGALSIAGAAYQGMFRNPMVSPDILGVSSGAGFGASLAILLSLNIFGIQIMAFAFGLLAVSLSYSISKAMGQSHDRTLMLVLAGMVVGTLFMSMVSLIKFMADTDTKLPAITFWLMGSLTNTSMDDLKIVVPLVIAGIVPLILTGWRLNILSFGEEEAQSLGVNTGRFRLLIILCASLVTGSVISITGHIGWVGLIIPHLARTIIGPDNKLLLPFSFIMGSTFLLLVDDLARTLSSLEIPLGIITSIIGAPFFLLFLKKSSNKTW